MNPVDPCVADYAPDVPVWGSGAEAAAHGMADIDAPGPEAARKIDGLTRRLGRGKLDK